MQENQRSRGFLVTLWLSFVGFIGNIFRKSPSTPHLPIPVTTSTSASVRVTHSAWVKGPSPLKPPPSSAASSPISSTARTTPVCRSRSATPRRDQELVFHPPPSPLPNISLSGLFATPNIGLGPLSLASPPQIQTLTPVLSPGTPSPFRGSLRASTPSFHSLHSRSTPSSAVIARLDRSSISPTTMSDGSLEVISLGDRRGFVGSPVKIADIARLPSPWSPIGKSTSSDVWMSVDGALVSASGPLVDDLAHPQDGSIAQRTHTLSLSRISTTSLYSSPLALDALGISVFVDLDVKDDPKNVPKPNQVRDENRPMLVTRDPQTPRKRRDTIPGIMSQSARPPKCLSTPLTNVELSHVRSATSISSMAYELRMGLFADGRSMSAFENIISLLDQASPDSVRMSLQNDTMQPVLAG